MNVRLEAHFDWRAKALFAARYDDLAKHYALPMTTVLDGRKVTVTTREDLVLNLHRFRLGLLEQGIQRLVPKVVAEGLPQGALQRVWIDWTAEGDGQAAGRVARAVYELERRDGWFTIISLRYDSMILPDFATPAFQRRLSRSRG